MKKTLAFILTLCLVLSCVMLPVTADTAVLDQDDKGNYLIKSESDFALIDVAAGNTYKLANDITVSGKVTTTLISGNFGGTLDGNGYAILIPGGVELTGSDGLLFDNLGNGDASKSGYVKNLTIAATKSSDGKYTNVVIKYDDSSAANMGVIAMNTNYSAYLTNVSIYAEISGGRTSATVNLGGYFGKTTNNVEFTNCDFYGSIKRLTKNTSTTADSIGGFIGNIADKNTKKFTDCNNYADIESVYAFAGGFAGNVSNSSGATITMTNCANYGDVAGGNSGVAGFIGNIANKTAPVNVTITGSKNEGKIDNDGQNTGGFIAVVRGSGTIKLDTCTNTGAVYGSQCAGLVGTVGSGSTAKIEIINSTNSGKIEGAYPAAIGGNFTNASSLKVTGCKNYGELVSENKIHEIIYNPATDTTLSNNVDYAFAAQNEGYQVQTVVDADTTQSVRVVASVDTNKYSEIGFRVVVKNADGTVVKTYNKACSYVYTKLLGVNGESSEDYIAKNLRGEGAYLIALTIKDIPEAQGTLTFEVSPYVVVDNYTVYGVAASFSHAIGTMPTVETTEA